MDLARWPSFREDAWTNAQGLGDPATDPIESYTAFPDGAPSHTEIDAMLHDDGIGARIVIRPVADALRDPPTIELQGEHRMKPEAMDKLAAEARDQLTELGGWSAALEAGIAGRAYGGGLLLIGTPDTRWDSPLDVTSIRKLTHFSAFSPAEMEVHQVQDAPGYPDYGKAMVYRLYNKVTSPHGGRSMRSDIHFHASRLIYFPGEETQRKRRERNRFWDDSIFSRIEYALKANAGAWHSTSGLMTKSNMVALKVRQLKQLIEGNGATGAWSKRAELMRASMSVLRWLLLDADQEEIENIQVSFGGLPELLDRVMMLVSAVSGIPVTILWTRSPAGMNATGDSDWRNYEDMITSYRSNRLESSVTQMYKALFLAKNGPTKGRDPGRFKLVWPKLRLPTDEEESKARLNDAQAFATLIDKQVYEPEQVALTLSGRRGYSRDVEVDHDLLQAQLDAQKEGLENNDYREPEPTVPDEGGNLPPGSTTGDEGTKAKG